MSVGKKQFTMMSPQLKKEHN